eukprot:g10760.t2
MQAAIYECSARIAGEEITGEVEVDSTQDYTGLVDVSGLSPETCYEVEVVFAPLEDAVGRARQAESTPAYATFDTPPLPTVMRPVRFAWGGDISGQNVCRDAEEGFPVMEALNSVLGKDFFLNVGDAIYGDGVCQREGLGQNAQVEGDFTVSADLDMFWAHWRYNLEDPGYQTLLSSQAFFMTWDDHEVVNDVGPGADERDTGVYTAGESLMPIGLQAFLNYNPIRATVDPTEPLAFYRTVRWGAAVELFILDTRQYRSLSTDEDSPSNPKTMLGETQLAWLKESMTNSTALWKIVVTSVPLSVPTGPGNNARDGWANFEGDTGYELELGDILTHISDGEMHNTVFIAADVHFAQSLRYQPFGNDTDFDFHEVIVGPLNAGPFNRPDLDDTFSPERLFYYAPEETTAATTEGNFTYLENIRPYFNFGVADIDVNGNLNFTIINTDNETLYTLSIPPREGTVPLVVTPTPSTLSPSPRPTPSPSSALVSPETTPSPSSGEGEVAPSAGEDSNPDAGLGGEDASTATTLRVPSCAPLPLCAFIAFFLSRMAGM